MSTEKHNIVKKGRPKKVRNQVPLPGPWRNSSWVGSFGGKGVSSLKYQEVSPSFILRQLLVLIEKGKFIDASQLLNKITLEALKDIILDIPIEAVIESIPQSLVVLESLYSRLFISDANSFPVEQFQVEVMVFHIVRYLSMLQSSMEYKYPKPEDAKKSIVNILRIVLHVNPDLVRTLYKRKKIMDTALQGIGEHGFIEMNGSLINLHDALKLEIDRNVTAYKGAVSTLDQLNLSHSKPVKINSSKKSGRGLNHQALTKLNENQVKSRLFKNKALLNAIESHIHSQLPVLITTLKQRIEYDKSALVAFGKLKSEIKTFSSHTKVVPLLAQYSKSLHTVLEMFKDLLDEHCGSDKSSYSTLGYHSDEDMMSVHEMGEEVASQEAVFQPDTEKNVDKKIPSPFDPIEQILGPAYEDHHEKMSLPSEDILEKRSRWWKHHRRSRSLDMGSSRGRRHSISSEQATPRTRSGSLDRSSISRPRKESVDESQEFQQMLGRIRDISASSPAIGRRQLERRGMSHPRSRDSSISPAALRRHFFGGGERTPSTSSQTDDIKDEIPEPLYATIKPKRLPPSKDVTKEDGTETKKLEEVLKECSHLAEREKILVQENNKLKEMLNLVTMKMAKMGGTNSTQDEVFLPELTDIAWQTSETSEDQEIPILFPGEESIISATDGSTILEKALLAPQAAISPPTAFSDSEPDSPPALAQHDARSQTETNTKSFVEQQKAVLREQAESLSRLGSKMHYHPPEELPESSVQQRKDSFERKLKTSHQDPAPVQVKKQPVNGIQKPSQPSSAAQQLASTDQLQEGPVQDKSSTEMQVELADPQDSTTKQEAADDQSHESPAQPKSLTDDQLSTPLTQSQTHPSQQKSLSESEQTEPVPMRDSTIQQNSSRESQKPVQIQQQTHQRKPPSPRKAKSATFSNQLHMAAIPESSSPAIPPKSASVVKQKRSLDSSPQRIHTPSNNHLPQDGGEKTAHTTRHLPKNHIRHVMGDLLYDYDKLYSEQRAVAWTCLTIPPEDKDAALFSVIVFSFQSAQTTIHELHMAKARMLQLPGTDDEESISSYTMDIPPDNRSQMELLEHLRTMGSGFDLKPMIMDVLEQVFEISEYYELLQNSDPMKKFVTSCVSLAWKLSIQSAPFIIDFELRSYDPAVHQRAPGSNRKSARVIEHIWPALLESTRGMCVYKGVVLT